MALSGKYFNTNFLPNSCDNKKHKDAPIAEQVHTKIIALKNGKRNPDKIERNSDPGMANVCKLKTKLRNNNYAKN